MAEDILGISAHFDLGDIQNSFQQLCDELSAVGVITESVARQMRKAMEDIGSASEDEIAGESIESLRQFLSFLSTLKDQAEDKVGKVSETVSKLSEALSKLKASREGMTIGSNEFSSTSAQIGGLETQLAAQQEHLAAARSEADLIAQSYSNLANVLSQVGQSGSDITLSVAPSSEDVSLLEEVVIQLSDAKQKTEELTQASEELRTKSEEMKGNILDMLKEFADGKSDMDLSELAEQLTQYQQTTSQALTAAQEAYGAQKDYIDQLGGSMDELVAHSHELAEAGDVDALQEVDKELVSIADKLDDSTDKLKSLATELENAKENAEGADEAMANFADIDKSMSIDNMKQGLSDLGNALKEAPSAFGEWLTGGDKFQQSIDGFKEGLDMLPVPLSNAFSGIKKMASAMMSMVKTPLGAVLAVIVLALQGLFKWFNKSAEGQKAFAKISAFVSSILDSLTDILVKVGEYLFHAFADAQGPMHDFASSLIKTVGSAIKGLYHNIKGIATALGGVWEMLKGNFKEGAAEVAKGGNLILQAWKEAGDTVKNAFSTIANGVSGLINMGKNGLSAFSFDGLATQAMQIKDRAVAAAKNAGEALKAEQELNDTREKGLKIEKQIAEEREKIAGLQGKEKEDALVRLRKLQSERFDDEINAYKKLLKLTKNQNSLHTKSLQDMDKEQGLRMQILSLEKQKASAMRAIRAMEVQSTKETERQEKAEKRKADRQKKQVDQQRKRDVRQENAEEKAAGKLNEVIYQNNIARIKEAQDLENDITKARIAAMKDGAQKMRLQRELNERQETEQLEKQRDKAIEEERNRQKAEFDAAQAIVKARGGKIRQWDEKKDLDQTEIDSIKQRYEELIELTRTAREQETSKELLNKYKSYYAERFSIEEKYTEDIRLLRLQRQLAVERGDKEEELKLTEAIARAQRNRGRELAALAVEQIKNDPRFVDAYDDLSKASADTLKELVKEFKNARKAAEQAGQPIAGITKEIEKIQAILTKPAPFVALKEAVDEARSVQNQLDRAKARLDAINNSRQLVKGFKPTTWEQGGFEAVLWTEEDAQEEVNKWQRRYVEAMAKVYDATQNAVNATRELQSSIKSLGNAIGGTAGNIVGMIGGIAGYASQGLEAATKSAKAAEAAQLYGDKMGAAMNKANMWVAAMTAMMQVINAVQNILPTADSLYEKAAKKQKEINDLTRAVNEYRLAVIESQQTEKNWFAADGLTSLTQAYEKHGKVVEAYYDEMYAAQERYKNKSAGISKALPYVAALAAVMASVVTFGTGAIAGAALLGATLTASLGTAAGAVTAAVAGAAAGIATAASQAAINRVRYQGDQVAAYQNLRIQTRHKTFFRGENTEDLRDWVRENLGTTLFDEQGLLNLEAAQTILDRYGDKLVGETRNTLERLVKLREQYDEFIDQIKEYVSDLYSPLVDSLTDALFEWLATGRDVLSQFRLSAQQTFADVARDMVRQMVIDKVFDKYKEQLQDIYAAFAMTGNVDSLTKDVLAATDTFMATAESQIPVLQDLIEQINAKFTEQGWDITGTNFGEESGSYKNAGSFTYDQANELNGRLAAVQIGIERGNIQRETLIELQTFVFNSSTAISINLEDMRRMQYDGLKRLSEIRDNTSVLPAMASDIRKMQQDIKDKL